LKCLKGQGIPAKQLNAVFCAIVMSRILYALPAWGGFLTNELVANYDVFLKTAVRWGYSCELKCLSDLLREEDVHLFRKIANNKKHCIHQLLHYHPQKFSP